MRHTYYQNLKFNPNQPRVPAGSSRGGEFKPAGYTTTGTISKTSKGAITTFENGHTVSTVWDQQSKNFTTLLTDSHNNQIGDAVYSGDKSGATLSHKWMVETFAETGKNFMDQAGSRDYGFND